MKSCCKVLWKRISLAWPLVALIIVTLPARAADGQVNLDDFEGELKDWQALKVEGGKVMVADADSRLAITNEATQVKTGRGALSYYYDIGPGVMRGLATVPTLNLAGMKSFHCWVKTSTATTMLFALDEKGGGSYQTTVYCPADTWQEVALNLNEFVLDNPAADPNGTFDVDQFRAMHLGDLACRMVNELPQLTGSRVLLLDDMYFSSQPVTATFGAVRTTTGGTFTVDNFETSLVHWLPATVFLRPAVGTPRMMVYDGRFTVENANMPGKGVLKFSYIRSSNTLQAALRNLERVDLRSATHLLLKMRTSNECLVMITITELDGSRYEQTFPLKPDGKFKDLVFSVPSFKLSSDSRDENGRLDAGQIKELGIADVWPSNNDEAQETSLWLDDVRFALGPR